MDGLPGLARVRDLRRQVDGAGARGARGRPRTGDGIGVLGCAAGLVCVDVDGERLRRAAALVRAGSGRVGSTGRAHVPAERVGHRRHPRMGGVGVLACCAAALMGRPERPRQVSTPQSPSRRSARACLSPLSLSSPGDHLAPGSSQRVCARAPTASALSTWTPVVSAHARWRACSVVRCGRCFEAGRRGWTASNPGRKGKRT